MVGCVSASGHYVPPMFIFPRVRMRPEFLDRGPVGAIGKGSKSGWICEDLFMQWFEHFLNHVQPKCYNTRGDAPNMGILLIWAP